MDVVRKSQKRKMPESSPPDSPRTPETDDPDSLLLTTDTKPVVITSMMKKDVASEPLVKPAYKPMPSPKEIESLTGILTMKKRLTESNAKVLRQQLLLLIHARVCKDDLCSLNFCKDIKRILTHITQCTLGKVCKEVHCLPCKQLLFHWKNCNSKECLICPPIRNASLETIMMIKCPSLAFESSAPASGSSSSNTSPRKSSIASSSGSSSNRSSVSIPAAASTSTSCVTTKNNTVGQSSKNLGNKSKQGQQQQPKSEQQNQTTSKKHNKKKEGQQNESESVENKTVSCPDFDASSLTKLQLIQHHLLMLIHASRCRKTSIKKPCSLPSCSIMKRVLSHVYKCSTPAEALVSSCRETFCFSSKVIILHWRSCMDENCVLCIPLRQADALMRKPSSSSMTATTSSVDKEMTSSSHSGNNNNNNNDQKSSAVPKSYAEI